MEKDKQLLDSVAKAIFDKKGCNIMALDLRGISTMTDYLVIGEGNVDRHVIALGLTVLSALREHGLKPVGVEGMENGDWIVIDCGPLLIHLFMPDVREKFGLEKLWSKGKLIDLNFETLERV